MKKSTLVGLGVWVVDLFAQLAASAWPDKIRPHPYWIIGVGVVGAALILYGVISGMHERWAKNPHGAWDHLQDIDGIPGKKFEASAETNNGNFVGGDNSGHQIHNAPGGTVIVGHGNVAASPQPTPKQAAPPPSQERLTWNVSFERVLFYSTQGLWRKDKYNGKLGVLAEITNPVPKPGQRHPESLLLVANLKFINGSRATRNISRAYWLNHPTQVAQLSVGDAACVVVGYIDGDSWVSHVNHHTPLELQNPFHSGFLPLGERIDIAISGYIDMEMALIDTYAQQTIDARKYRLLHDQKGWSIGGRPMAKIPMGPSLSGVDCLSLAPLSPVRICSGSTGHLVSHVY